MRIATVIKLAIVIVLLCAAATVGYAYSGLYDVAASEPDNAVMRWLLVTVRDHSIERRAAAIEVPPLTDPQLIQEGFEHYHEMCVSCHLAPGVESSEIRLGLNPQPPVLTQRVPHTSPARLFWVIKNGVKMSGMPAWGTSHSDQMIWAMVAFLEKMPTMTPAEYQAMEKQLGNTPGDDEDTHSK
ncbi:MAG TPA: cytochrome c [Gammaproteobacteria bacterium]|nr:cytochrome c [Gammaproteobacteria bacterium]